MKINNYFRFYLHFDPRILLFCTHKPSKKFFIYFYPLSISFIPFNLFFILPLRANLSVTREVNKNRIKPDLIRTIKNPNFFKPGRISIWTTSSSTKHMDNIHDVKGPKVKDISTPKLFASCLFLLWIWWTQHMLMWMSFIS